MTALFSPIANTQFFDASGNPLVGGKVYTYLAGTNTPAATYTTSVGNVAQANPAILNALGVLDSPLYLSDGIGYKIIITDAANVSLGLEYDQVYGVPSAETSAVNEWVRYSGAFSYISSTSFSVAGDQTQIFQTTRRLKTLVTAGTAYHIISTAVYTAPDTLVTVSNTYLSLDAGLNQLSYGFLAPNNSAIPESVIGSALRVAATPAVLRTIAEVSSTTEMNAAIAAADTALGATKLGIQYLQVQDQKASGTNAGASVAGSNDRTLNTVVFNTMTGASLASNQVTLAAGTYRVTGWTMANAVNAYQARLFNTTDSTVTCVGTPNFSTTAGGTSSPSILDGRFTIAASKTFKLITYCAVATAGNGLGNAAISGQIEIYSSLTFIRE